jgi:hypothetical protein
LFPGKSWLIQGPEEAQEGKETNKMVFVTPDYAQCIAVSDLQRAAFVHLTVTEKNLA